MAEAAVNSSAESQGLSTKTRLDLYRLMLRIRLFEQAAYDLFMAGLIRGTSHLSLGQEAVAAGFAAAMRTDDYSFCTYRGHSHTIARGVPLAPIMGELIGKAGGLMGGKGGSMHLTSVAHGLMGSYAIVGAHLPVAAGSAWSAQYRGSGQVSVCFFGDGATNIGAFHEALNLAVIWRLPVVFVCENNQYQEYTKIEAVTAVSRPAADRAAAYGLAPIAIDGNDVDVVYATAQRVLDQARGGDGPALVEAATYRHGGHSRADPGTYRPNAEVQEWLSRDPLPAYRQRLADLNVDAAELETIARETAAEVEAAVEAAKNMDEPNPHSALTEVWANGGSSWRS